MSRSLVLTFFAVLTLMLPSCGIDNNISSTVDQVRANPRAPVSTTQVDRVLQNNTTKVDVLWLIDNSCSMSCVVGCHTAVSEEVAENFPLFMQFFEGSGLDYHIGVVTTDMDLAADRGKLQPGLGNMWIDTDTPNPTEVFFDMAAQGTDGSGDERGLDAVYLAIEGLADLDNAGFFRDDANLHVIALTNEPAHPQNITIDEFISWFDLLKDNEEWRSFNGIVCTNTGTDMCRDGTSEGYLEVINSLGGAIWDVGQPDWAQILEELGEKASGARREYFLTQIPKEETIEVSVVDQGVTMQFEEGTDWFYTVTRNSVTFNEFVPSSLAEILITYELANTGE